MISSLQMARSTGLQAAPRRQLHQADSPLLSSKHYKGTALRATAHGRIVFSDIDGTIAHQLKPGADRDSELLVMPPSSSGLVGVISAGTIRKVGHLRESGAYFAIITGARLSTLLMRLPYLPQADAFVCENGGRIFYPGSVLPTACPLSEDEVWRTRQAVAGAGPGDQDTQPPAQREGALWDWLRQVQAEGWRLDVNGYTTSFRVYARDGKTAEQLEELKARTPPQLACSSNFGAADFYPNTSGKVMAARYLMDRWGVQAKMTCFLCDDDNDMELAQIVGKAFVPTVTSESVHRAVAARPDHFVMSSPGLSDVEATEEMVDAVAKHYGLAPVEAVMAEGALLRG